MAAYSLFLSEKAREHLRSFPRDVRRNIGYRIHLLQEDFSGDIKKLEANRDHYRLRVGTYLVLFRLNGNTIEVYAVKQR